MPQPASSRAEPDNGPRVGVIITAFNAERYVGTAIASVKAQGYDNLRCVVVDDGSSDRTVAVAHAAIGDDPRFSVLTKPNAGVGRARDAGLAGLDPAPRYVMFLDCDDVLEPDALTLLISAAQRPGVIGAHGLADRIDEYGRPLDPGGFARHGRRRLTATKWGYRALRTEEATDFSAALISHTLFPPAVLLISRDAYGIAGPWSQVFCEDWEMNLRLLAQGPLAFVDVVVARYRTHAESRTSVGSRNRPRIDNAVSVNAVMVGPNASAESRRLARRAWRACQAASIRQVAAEITTESPRIPSAADGRRVARLIALSARWSLGRPTKRRQRRSRRLLREYGIASSPLG